MSQENKRVHFDASNDPPGCDRRRFLRAGVSVLGAGMACATLPSALAATLMANRGQTKIAQVRAYALPKAVFVQVIADDGTQGWGEAGHEGDRHAARLINELLDSLVEGRDVFDADGIWSRLYHEGDELGPAGVLGMAISGIDNALWDLRGKLLGLPLWALLGGKFRDRITLYGSFSRATGEGYMTPVECAKRAASLVEEGFRTIKLRMSIREENLNPDPDPTLPAVREVRRAIGDDIDLYVDPNNGYSAARAIMVGRRLQDDFNVKVYEGPVAKHHWPSLAEVADALDMEVAEGEYAATRWQFRDLILQASGRVESRSGDSRRRDRSEEGAGPGGDLRQADRRAQCAADPAQCRPFAFPRQLRRRQPAAGAPGPRTAEGDVGVFRNQILPDAGSIAVPDTPGVGLIVNEAKVRADAEARAR
ncbi:MAG: hypothetical protein HC937_02905 [Aquincola sp.]|nr:hypothetical protein [Aquincola sp.]